jgi:hypothetical protein
MARNWYDSVVPVLHLIPDEDDPWGIVAALVEPDVRHRRGRKPAVMRNNWCGV